MKAQRLPKRTALHKEPQGRKPGRQAPEPALSTATTLPGQGGFSHDVLVFTGSCAPIGQGHRELIHNLREIFIRHFYLEEIKMDYYTVYFKKQISTIISELTVNILPLI